MPGDHCGIFQKIDPESGRCRFNVPDCVDKAASSAITGTALSGPKGGALAGGLRFTVCKTIESIETGTPNQHQSFSSTRNRNQSDSAPQLPVNNEPYYQDPDPILDNEFDVWRTEEEFVTVEDVEHVFTADFDL
ncbi:hypothetical protein [Haloarchaeobius baliensis]|uniref:hypothetical protein n=1 Tax=Haloarchaeobius baliensis TaxID=1670458 RepID=UPI003F8845D2